MDWYATVEVRFAGPETEDEAARIADEITFEIESSVSGVNSAKLYDVSTQPGE